MEVYKKSAEKEAPRKVLLGDIDDNVAADYVAPTALGAIKSFAETAKLSPLAEGKL